MQLLVVCKEMLLTKVQQHNTIVFLQRAFFLTLVDAGFWEEFFWGEKRSLFFKNFHSNTILFHMKTEILS